MIASILLLKFARTSTISFARMLGLYLQGSGINGGSLQFYIVEVKLVDNYPFNHTTGVGVLQQMSKLLAS